MAYHPLTNETGGTPDDRRSEADRLLDILADIDGFRFTTKEDQFIGEMRQGGPVTQLDIVRLRDIKRKYLD